MDRRWPFVLFIALLLAARRAPAGWAAGLGLAFGLIRDSVNLTTFGSDMVVMTVLGYLGSRTRDYFVGDSMFFLALYLFLGKWMHDAFYFVVGGALGVEDPVSMLLMEAPLAAAYSAFAGLIAYSAYRTFAR